MEASKMTAAEFKVRREAVGVPAQWIADVLCVGQRTVRRWEDGKMPVRPDVVNLIEKLESYAGILADRIREGANVHGGATTYRVDLDWVSRDAQAFNTDLPAQFHRAVVAGVRREYPNLLIDFAPGKPENK